jgi:hypothetical protein
MMFVAGEDFYFLAYTTLLIMAELGCTSTDRIYLDVTGIPYLADLVSHEADLKLALMKTPLSQTELARLSLLYDRAAARSVPFERVLTALVERGLLELRGRDPRSAYLKVAPTTLKLNDELFDGERERIVRLRQLRLSRIRRTTLTTKLFGSHGVRTWGD